MVKAYTCPIKDGSNACNYFRMKSIPVRGIKRPLKEPKFLGNFSIRDVGLLLAGKDMVQELHRHDHFFILVLKKGTGKHEIDFVSYPVCDHSVFIMYPGQVHLLTLKSGSVGYLMQFSADFYFPQKRASNQLPGKVVSRNLCQLDPDRFKKLFSLLTHILQEYTHQQVGFEEVIKADLGIFFIELDRHHQKNKSPVETNNPYHQEKLEEFLRHLEMNVTQIKQVSAYAKILNLSSYQLNTITKATTGRTCSELINEHILLESKRLLLATSNQVKEIAYALGYEDVSYFIRFFKKHTGHSPETFRNNFK